MNDPEHVRKLLELALAFAHAALDEPTMERALEAKKRVAELVPHIQHLNLKALTLTEACEILEMVKQLRRVTDLTNRSLEKQFRQANKSVAS